MKIGVLLCDHVRDELKPEFGDYPQMFQRLFQKQQPQLTITFFDVVNGDFPSDINSCDGYLCSGSRFGVNDKAQWIRQLVIFVRALYAADIPFVGICFGHQLIAKALGGTVEKSKKGWGVGVAKARMQSHVSWMQPQVDDLHLVVSHQDQVTQLPDSTQVLASSEFCPYSMMLVGKCFLGMQGHPEFSRGYSHALMQMRKQEIGETQVEDGVKSLQYDVHDEELADWIVRFIQNKP